MRFLTLFLIIIFCSTQPLWAKAIEDRISGKIQFSLSNDYVYESDDDANGYNKSYAEIETALSLKLSESLAVRSFLRFEEVSKNSSEVDLGEGYSFDDEGLIIEELALQYSYKKLTVEAGKFTANFANGWKWENGIWIDEFVEKEYRIAENLGVSAFVDLGDKHSYGGYRFTISGFTNDTKNLDNSIITKRDDTASVGANAGDKRGLFSYVGAMDVDFVFSQKEQLSYHFSYSNLAINERQATIPSHRVDDQQGFAANIHYKYNFDNPLAFDGFLEYVNFNNFAGDIDRDVDYINANVMLTIYQNWRVVGSHLQKRQMQIGTNGIDSVIAEFSVGYAFDEDSIFNGLSILAGQRRDSVDNKSTIKRESSFGLLVNYVKSF
ncbi:MAG: hypothetical protein O3B09_00080 [Proteobacteria bacterium]|nr:hypothetical protein [Pseudomonadota bacterium]